LLTDLWLPLTARLFCTRVAFLDTSALLEVAGALRTVLLRTVLSPWFTLLPERVRSLARAVLLRVAVLPALEFFPLWDTLLFVLPASLRVATERLDRVALSRTATLLSFLYIVALSGRTLLYLYSLPIVA